MTPPGCDIAKTFGWFPGVKFNVKDQETHVFYTI